MPVYNGEAFLRKALDSLLSQIYTDWELVVVDDGSIDSTPRILEGIADRRIRVIRQSNSGEAHARNVGLQQARGEYVAFLDSDDYYFPNALGDLSTYLDRHPEYDVVFSDGLICDEQDQLVMTLGDVRPGIYTGSILDQVVISSSVVTVPVCTMTRKSSIIDHSVEFDRNVVIGPDWDFWIQLAVHAKFGYLDKVTCKYRIHTTNITRTTRVEKRKKDQIYRRTKILNAEWFCNLKSHTRELFFLDLLTNTLTGDTEKQHGILRDKRFSGIPLAKQAELWRMVGIDALQMGRSKEQVKHFLEESIKLNPEDPKTRTLLWSLYASRWLALTLVNLWHLLLRLRKKTTSLNNSKSEQLQVLLGLRQ